MTSQSDIHRPTASQTADAIAQINYGDARAVHQAQGALLRAAVRVTGRKR
jgi:hypothetical protein